MAKVRYHLNTDKVDGLAELIGGRQQVLQGAVRAMGHQPDKRDADKVRDVWADKVATFWVNDPFLSKFDRNELFMDFGRDHCIHIVGDRPLMHMAGPTIVLDERIEGEAEREPGIVILIELEQEFERLPGESDPRGSYSEDYAVPNGPKLLVSGFVAVRGGKYHLTAQAWTQYTSQDAPPRRQYYHPQDVLDRLASFAFDVIRGELKPVGKTTVT